jgi:glycosyltransferase involved in cell wall biosynthesis
MATIVFYTHDSATNLDKFEYYKQDIDALRELGHKVLICTNFIEIPIDFDAMFIWWWTHALLPVLLCRTLNRPCIITGTFNFRFPEGFKGTDYFRRPRWQRFLIKAAVKACNLNLFVNQTELRQCVEYFNLRNARYFPHCVHGDYLRGPSNKRRKALFNLAWSGRHNLVRKGIPELLEAIGLLRDKGKSVELFLAGLEGDGLSYILERIQQLGIENEVRYLGSLTRQEKIALLRENEVFVQPSHYEGFGLAILESMGCGACVIVCDVGGVREVVADCGLYVSPSSPQELASAIEKVLEDSILRRNLQNLALERAKSLFTADKKAERLQVVLAEFGIR